MKLTHLSLCSGIGGIDLAAEWAGFTTVAQCEIDDYASKVLAKNFKGVPNLHDIRTVTNARLREHGIDPASITVLSAGFPCQPYSLAGKGKGDGDERDLWGEVARCIGEIKPRWFVGENTPGLFARVNQRYFKRILADLTALGYSVSWGIWGACDVGAPHRRDRVFIVGRNVSDAAVERFGADTVQRGDATESGRETFDEAIHFGGMQSDGVCGSISDTAGIELGMQGKPGHSSKAGRRRDGNHGRAKEDDSREWWETEPDVGRVADGVSNRVDRLRCLGNAVVPQQAYPIFKAISEAEGEEIC